MFQHVSSDIRRVSLTASTMSASERVCKPTKSQPGDSCGWRDILAISTKKKIAQAAMTVSNRAVRDRVGILILTIVYTCDLSWDTYNMYPTNAAAFQHCTLRPLTRRSQEVAILCA
jgi:hypothetical protein